ncbi:MAG: hypothetical protein KatS3mg119_0789 [Rhodothalassiaceae bacterium]|nr:MAG: hypothetical protein KatS3mg119_0789 [Rhodothalassiaceae bacterium]
MVTRQIEEERRDDEDYPLNVSVATVSYIIERIHEAIGELALEDSGLEDEEEDGALPRGAETELAEVAEFIDNLSEEERIDLVVLMWIGRGSYEVDELEQARADAAREATQKTSDYLLSTPLVADYLADGLEALGYAPEEY